MVIRMKMRSLEAENGRGEGKRCPPMLEMD
jgi:hypothetical protein